MRTVVMFTMFAVLAGAFCGGRTGSQPLAVAEKFPVEATGALTEDAMVQFIKVLPRSPRKAMVRSFH
jgi:hypothetical protein